MSSFLPVGGRLSPQIDFFIRLNLLTAWLEENINLIQVVRDFWKGMNSSSASK